MHSKQYTAAGATAGYIHIDNGVLVLYSRLVRCASSRDGGLRSEMDRERVRLLDQP